MSADKIHYATIRDIGEQYVSKTLSPVEVTEAILKRIDGQDDSLKSYVTVMAESAMGQAKAAESEITSGSVRGPLHGIPVAIKDLCATAGVKTTCGTRILKDWVPNFTATVIERLDAAGAIVIGKTKLTEGAFSEHHPDVVAPINPWNKERWTGVSSSGSGVAVAAGLAFGAIGTDTGGSIRFPSACNGIVGIKPTWGRVSRYGVYPLADSLDHVGPMTRSVWDAAVMLAAMAGHDPNDPTSLHAEVPDYTDGIEDGIRGLRIGVDPEYAYEGIDEEFAHAVKEAVEVLAGLGARITRIRLPPRDALLHGWVPFCAVEAAIAHAENYPAKKEDYGPAFSALLDAGNALSAMDFGRIMHERLAFAGALKTLLDDVDLILCPGMPLPAPDLAEMGSIAGEPNATAEILRFTAPFDFTGSPTISLPCGFTGENVPLGFQLVGRHLDEALLCRAGLAYEQATDWLDRHPDVG